MRFSGRRREVDSDLALCWCYGPVCLRWAAWLLLPGMFAAALFLLYARVDPHEHCDWCGSLSCVELPPWGATDAGKWWDCTVCGSADPPLSGSGVNGTLTAAGALFTKVRMKCPAGGAVKGTLVVGDLPTFGEDWLDAGVLTDLCRVHCAGMDYGEDHALGRVI